MLKNRIIWLSITGVMCVIAVIYITFAWMSENKNVESVNQGMKIQSISELTTIDGWALKFDGVYGALCYEVTADSNEITMAEYDEIFRDRNENTPLIYVLKIGNVPDNEGDSLLVRIPCTQYYSGTSNSGNFTSESQINNYISNVICAKIGCSGAIADLTPTTDSWVDNNVAIFNTERDAFASVTSGAAYGEFVKLTTGTSDSGAKTFLSYEKSNEIELKLEQSEYTDKLFEKTEEDGTTTKCLILYLEIDYSSDLIDPYAAYRNEDDATQNVFNNDIGTIQVSIESN